MATIPVHTDDADLDDPSTTWAAWSASGIICDYQCPTTFEHAMSEAKEYLRLNPGAEDVYVYAFTPGTV